MRLSELVATLSLVSDLGMGRPMEHALRQTLISLRLADAAGMGAGDRTAAYYTSLLTWIGCAADTSELAAFYGDEAAMYADTRGEDLGGMTMARFAMRHLGGDGPRFRRVGMVGKFLVTAGRSVQRVMESHCLAASEFADRLELGARVSQPLMQAFERWDGKGVPGKAGATDLSPAIRLVHLADLVEASFHGGGTEAALEVATERRGTQFDPALVDCFVANHGDVLAGLGEVEAWDEVIALDPTLREPLSPEQLDIALAAFGDYADLKCRPRVGHSRGVAALASGAARQLGMPAEDEALVRRAAFVHDLGMIGVSSTVWDEQRPWTVSQRERARTHPYLTERMLARVPALAAAARCASLHHERLDGSGYPHGLARDAIPMPARVVAAADVYDALRNDRPHRRAVPDTDAANMLRDEARAGRLDADAVGAVLAAAGRRVRPRQLTPGGLTPRETEVLVQLAQGRSNPEIANALTLSRKTVSAHLEHIYAKLGVSTRTQAALFAMRTGLIGDLPDATP